MSTQRGSAQVVPLAVSPELAAWVKSRSPARDDLATAYETGEVETRRACPRRNGARLPNQSSYRHLQFVPRRERRCQPGDREHQHRLAFSGAVPGEIAALALRKSIKVEGSETSRLTTAGIAVLTVIAGEHRGRGLCNLSLKEIADRARTCRKTVKRVLKVAALLRLISIEIRPVCGFKHLTSVIRIVSDTWKRWLRRARGAANAAPEKVTGAAEAPGTNRPPTGQPGPKRGPQMPSGWSKARTTNAEVRPHIGTQKRAPSDTKLKIREEATANCGNAAQSDKEERPQGIRPAILEGVRREIRLWIARWRGNSP